MRETPIDLIFRAVSDRTRLRILHLLRTQELCVGNLVCILRVPQPTVSRHLSYLRRARLVSTRRAGLLVYYALAPVRNAFHARLLDCLGSCFGDVPEIRADATRARRIRKSSLCCAP